MLIGAVSLNAARFVGACKRQSRLGGFEAERLAGRGALEEAYLLGGLSQFQHIMSGGSYIWNEKDCVVTSCLGEGNSDGAFACWQLAHSFQRNLLGLARKTLHWRLAPCGHQFCASGCDCLHDCLEHALLHCPAQRMFSSKVGQQIKAYEVSTSLHVNTARDNIYQQCPV